MDAGGWPADCRLQAGSWKLETVLQTGAHSLRHSLQLAAGQRESKCEGQSAGSASGKEQTGQSSKLARAADWPEQRPTQPVTVSGGCSSQFAVRSSQFTVSGRISLI